MAFLLWRLPAGGRLVLPFARSRRSRTAVPRLGPALRRCRFGPKLSAALSSASCLPGLRLPMAPWRCPVSVGAAGSGLHSAQDSGEGTSKGQGKGSSRGSKGKKGSAATLQQLGHLAPQARALQSSAAAMGWALSLTPKGHGKGSQKGSNQKTAKRSASTKVLLQDLQVWSIKR